MCWWGNHLFVIFAVLDVSLAVNVCINCSFFTFICVTVCLATLETLPLYTHSKRDWRHLFSKHFYWLILSLFLTVSSWSTFPRKLHLLLLTLLLLLLPMTWSWLLTQIWGSRYCLTSNNSKMVQDRTILTVADWQEVEVSGNAIRTSHFLSFPPENSHSRSHSFQALFLFSFTSNYLLLFSSVTFPSCNADSSMNCETQTAN